MDALWTALIAAGAALAGSALAHWGAARLQAQRFSQEQALQQTGEVRQQRAACLGWVLQAVQRMEALLLLQDAQRLEEDPQDQRLSRVPAAESAATAAREAYAVALLSLAAVRPVAKAFYLSTARLQLAIESPPQKSVAECGGVDAAALGRLSAAWRKDYEALEKALSGDEAATKS